MNAAWKKVFSLDLILSAAVFALALLVRWIYLIQFQKSPFFDTPIIDAQTYLQLAQNLVQGFWIQEEAFWQPPLYPYWLGVVLWLTGPSPLRLHLAHFLVGALNCALIYRLGRRLFSRPVALAAGIIAAGYGTFLFFEGDYLPVPLIILFNLALLLVLLRIPDHPSFFRFGAAGVLFGLSALTRPDILVFLPAAALWLAWRLRPAFALRPLAVRLGLLAAAGLLTISPATIHNAFTSREFVLISSNGGINFYIGNNRDADAFMKIRPYAWDNFVIQPLLAGAVRPGERSEWFYRRAVKDLRQDPSAWLWRLGRKTCRFFRGHEYLRNQDPYLARNYSSLLSSLLWEHGLALPYGIIGPLGLLGLILLGRERRPDRVLLVLYAGAQVVAIILFMAAARYRMPTVPALILAASWLPAWAEEKWRQKKRFPLLLAALAAVGLLLAGNLSGSEGPEMGIAEQLMWQGYAAKTHGNLAEAERLFRKVTKEFPDYLPARLDLASSLAEEGQGGDSREQLNQILELDSAHPGMVSANARILLAKLDEGRGDSESAIRHYRAALAIFPAAEEAMLRLTPLLLDEDRTAEAEAVIQNCLRYYPNQPWAFRSLAAIRWNQGRRKEAISLYQRAAKLNHLDQETRLFLARYYASSGNRRLARRYLDQVLRYDPQNFEARQLRALLGG